ncbi:MAG: acyl-CoA dehydrogenase family protein [Actinomycetota bacterium]
MDLTLTDEQRLLAETARAFVARSCPPGRVRELEERGPDPELWQAMAALDWPGLALPEEHGGAGRGMVELTIVCEELGRGAVPSPLATTVTLAALPVLGAGSAEQRDRWLPALARGERVGTLALLEPGMADEWDAPTMPGTGTISGTKLLVPWAETADLLVVATGDGLRVVETEAAGPAVRVAPHDALGGEPLASVDFEVWDSEPLGADDEARAVVDRALDHAAAASLGYAAGLAERMLELSVQHARERRQFDRPIGSFQAIAHRCADMRADVDACRYLAYQAAWALDRPGSADAEVAAAKSYANEALRRVAMHAHQVHGAIGFSTEHDLHLFSRRAKAFELSYGSTARHRERLATAMGLRA